MCLSRSKSWDWLPHEERRHSLSNELGTMPPIPPMTTMKVMVMVCHQRHHQLGHQGIPWNIWQMWPFHGVSKEIRLKLFPRADMASPWHLTLESTGAKRNRAKSEAVKIAVNFVVFLDVCVSPIFDHTRLINVWALMKNMMYTKHMTNLTNIKACGLSILLQNMSSSIGLIIPTIWKNEKCSQPTNQVNDIKF